MVTHEPKCVQWKRRGADEVAAKTAGLSRDEELRFWQQQTRRLRHLQETHAHAGSDHFTPNEANPADARTSRG
jgi:hypothetical protein